MQCGRWPWQGELRVWGALLTTPAHTLPGKMLLVTPDDLLDSPFLEHTMGQIFINVLLLNCHFARPVCMGRSSDLCAVSEVLTGIQLRHEKVGVWFLN